MVDVLEKTMARTAESPKVTRGVIFIHSAPQALCAHVEWAIAQTLLPQAQPGDRGPDFSWSSQNAQPGTWRMELTWSGKVGTGAALVSSLRGWPKLRFDVTEEPTAATEGSRWSHTPALGIHHAVMAACGNLLIGEDRLRAAMQRSAGSGSTLQAELELLLGSAWDAELEPFRYAGQGAPVRWLHRVG